ncbi:cadherin EGF LAG seven-pass G-type receptor 2-like [Sylvia atricapilla]|uniref:cadherin EGF LAG seven-pass G-type receptor 2-like n=1 Tax=Sylvia atricapilla TaxID=48155 RepID=UPI003397CE65
MGYQAYGRDSTYVAGQMYPSSDGGSSGSLHSTTHSAKSHHSYIPFMWRQRGRGPPQLRPLPRAPPGPLGPGDPLVPLGCPYWPGEFVTTASESEGPGGSEGLQVQPAGGQGHPWGDPPRPKGKAHPRDPLLLPLPHPTKVWAAMAGVGPPNLASPPMGDAASAGILKKCLPPISERGSAQCPGLPPQPPACTAASSGSDGGGLPVPRPRQSLQEQLSSHTAIAMSIRTGTADEDSSGSESDETSI